jgi:hypothetical protein
MAADLHPRTVRPDAIGVVHDGGREPEDPALDGVERREVGGGRPLLLRRSALISSPSSSRPDPLASARQKGSATRLSGVGAGDFREPR